MKRASFDRELWLQNLAGQRADVRALAGWLASQADDNGIVAGGTTHPGPASSEEFSGRQRRFSGVTGTVPEEFSACRSDGSPGIRLTLRASCTGDVTGTISSGGHSVTCDSGAGEEDIVEKEFWAELDGTVAVDHSPTGWQGWAEACEGVGPCEIQMRGDMLVEGRFGAQP